MEGRKLTSRWYQNEAKGRKGPMKAVLIHNLVYVLLIMEAHRHQCVDPWKTPATQIFIKPFLIVFPQSTFYYPGFHQ